MVDRMLDLLAEPRPRSRSGRLRNLLLGLDDPEPEWRRGATLVFSDLRRRLDDPDERFGDEAAQLTRWMDWDSDLERQPAEVRQLTTKIQHALELLERSRGLRTA
jgi:hypothetical protein